MNYQKHYDALINRARSRTLTGYKERHHCIPRCMGGSDDKSNIVELTAREHFVCHQLLVKMYPDNQKIIYALWMMGNSHTIRNNKMYEWIKIRVSLSVKTNPPSPRGPMFGRKMSDEHKKKLSDIGKKRKVSEETKQKMRVPKGPMSEETKNKLRVPKGPMSEEHKKKISDSIKGNKQTEEHIEKRRSALLKRDT